MSGKLSKLGVQTVSNEVEAAKETKPQPFYCKIAGCDKCYPQKTTINGCSPSVHCALNIIKLKKLNRGSISYALSSMLTFDDMYKIIADNA